VNLSTPEQVNAAITAEVVKKKWTPSPEHLAKLAEARKKYQEGIANGTIKPPVRQPKPPVTPVSENTGEAGSSLKSSEKTSFDGYELKNPTTFELRSTRLELFVKNGSFDTDPIPALYLTIHRDGGKTTYEIENLAGDLFTTGNKWEQRHHKLTTHIWDDPAQLAIALSKINIIVPVQLMK
jgi:hypothetical protein